MMKRVFVLLLLCGMAWGQTTKTVAAYECFNTYDSSVHVFAVIDGKLYRKTHPLVVGESLVDCRDDAVATTMEINAPEPEDVPAITIPGQEKRIPVQVLRSMFGIKDKTTDDEFCETYGPGVLDGKDCVKWEEERTTCADKLRILEHDESEPPHYWCRKPQTESK
jgi:hypothetical protein